MPPEAGKKLTSSGTTVKSEVEITFCPGDKTAIFPVEAFAGTVKVILVAVTADTFTPTLFNKTEMLVEGKFVPVMVTVVPDVPLVGLKLVIEEVAEKSVALVADKPPTCMVIFPVVALLGSVTVKLVAVAAVTVAVAPLNFTSFCDEVVEKLVPVMVTTVPAVPEVGVNETMEGARFTVKSVVLVAVCPFTITLILPVDAPVGTVVVSEVAVAAVTVALIAPNFTWLLARVALKLFPLMVTVAPISPLVGVKLEMLGAGDPDSSSSPQEASNKTDAIMPQ
jgi:hypothetical protein